MSLVTTLPAPITDPLPTVTPAQITTLLPIHTLSSITTLLQYGFPHGCAPYSALMICGAHCNIGRNKNLFPYYDFIIINQCKIELLYVPFPIETVFPIASVSGGSIHTLSPQKPAISLKFPLFFSFRCSRLIEILAKAPGVYLLIHVFASINP